MTYPLIIQGGMGAGVSNWCLANAVARAGQLGVVSGTALDTILSRRLQLGDHGGHVRRAFEHFPIPDMAQRVLDGYFVPGGKPEGAPFKRNPVFTVEPSPRLLEMTVIANFVEVFLAKEGHKGKIGINYLEKIQLPNLASIFGAMLAGVDYVLMGAGIPREIPGVLDRLVNHEEVAITLNIEGATRDDDFKARFNPREFSGTALPALKRPKFLAIIASTVLARTLATKSTGMVDGFVIEGHTAGGHNASPRGPLTLNEAGEPIYGAKDEVELDKIKSIGRPFWLAGHYGSPEKLKEALEQGANGVQVGTIFALCDESGLEESLRKRLINKVLKGEARVFTDPKASPTGFPFKVASLEHTNSEREDYEARPRICDIGYLRHVYKKEDGGLGYRCPSEPVDRYVAKGGKLEDTVDRKCLCNGLLSNIGLPQIQKNGGVEKPLVTAGEDIDRIKKFIDGKSSYTAEDVINYLLGN